MQSTRIMLLALVSSVVLHTSTALALSCKTFYLTPRTNPTIERYMPYYLFGEGRDEAEGIAALQGPVVQA